MVLRFCLRTRAKFWVTKKENYKQRESDISHICPDARNGSIALNFGVRGEIADLITHVKFYVNRFTGFGAVTPRNLLHCDIHHERTLSLHSPAAGPVHRACWRWIPAPQATSALSSSERPSCHSLSTLTHRPAPHQYQQRQHAGRSFTIITERSTSLQHCLEPRVQRWPSIERQLRSSRFNSLNLRSKSSSLSLQFTRTPAHHSRLNTALTTSLHYHCYSLHCFLHATKAYRSLL